MALITFLLLLFLTSLTIQSSDYVCQQNNVSVRFSLLTSNHSASNPILNCSLQQCNDTSVDNQTYLLSPTPCFNYRTINNLSYCAPALQCTILELCDNVTYRCASNNSICIINSCCSSSPVCLPLFVTKYFQRRWAITRSMNATRLVHTASVLSNGKVLVAGGMNDNFLNSAELYDPSTGTWTSTANMSFARHSHTASVLSNGKVLVAGGLNVNSLNSAELYDPSTSTWTSTANMSFARGYHTASVLSNGKVFVAGGWNGNYLNSAELYDPSTSTWTSTANMSFARVHHTASVLSNGKVLVAGGLNVNFLNSTELYDPSTSTWTSTANMSFARHSHTASVLSNGKVLVAGGRDINSYLNSAELY